ncbi:bifunctional diaminohydroxyphosphoribosylaminopyrimidine deaminase/5-amino-6-(5-phosphoribosylamino)uracil reductase RibD [Clostridiaceae bacterium UIB06]|uniref:Riboflavin biosynthesis protein RibD n=1 Tax=Clostridium thailandense TaxID=2794346 RepID=A0A949X636_9CLOT|nr:bifunctional diaminohydroxyphosphoribosylaminopyrimidine deaminase/5-amino-6-(5-phosphoribosylamino)uracil reductase RibD [Clostridium thailandense]MBV7276693.1 bifunctional diaminohydroxyphosphoribosylaminopyrimidine deaminase/5-amino-6-(5-phosphoribosylamino)uracil reductase RibD [Clostridium thailandense]MCH5135643.1 bifunctional diaminohydroxyphosphoribosylaminopyrimidine deaminase/5-amino-6-(5-phosphoribosylamino)uracil reductase RibD [Clostridiaceae bacterium UIB06]
MNNRYPQVNESYMNIALDLAKKGEGAVNPNPLVGAVVVKDNEIVGRGYHKFYGGPHAEVYALREAGEKAAGADIYVSLEPCSHYGKTPPCVEAIKKAGIKRVIVAMKDPNPLVAGRGINFLKENGIEVITGILEDEAKALNEIFIKYITSKMPFVILKTAMTIDGKIATFTGDSKWISGEESREYVHRIRNKVMGIMAGIGTIIKDDPLLTTRVKEEEGKSPKAIIIDSKLRIPLEAKILGTVKEREVIIACTDEFDNDKKNALEQKGVRIIVTPKDGGSKVDLKYLVEEIGKLGIDSILLEGGGTLNFSALNYGIVNKIICFIAPKILGGQDAKTSVEGKGVEKIQDAIKVNNIEYKTIGKDLLLEGYIEY